MKTFIIAFIIFYLVSIGLNYWSVRKLYYLEKESSTFAMGDLGMMRIVVSFFPIVNFADAMGNLAVYFHSTKKQHNEKLAKKFFRLK